jgi:SAM-dependent methyltransferase
MANDFIKYEENILNKLNLKYSGLLWCELGNQICYGPPIVAAKKIYARKGVIHTSIDINGKNGALPLNLDNPVPDRLINKFDVVTNYGTVEHVDNQYEAFRNIHRLCKNGGLIIHVFPVFGSWPKHCKYYYNEEFAYSLIARCCYNAIDVTSFESGVYKFPKNVLACALVKDVDIPFLSNSEFNEIPGLIDSGFTNRTG